MNISPMTLEMAIISYQPEQRAMLQMTVETARAVFSAEASSIFLLAPDRSALTFEAVAGRGEQTLVGTRVAVDRGIAGWVLASGQPLAVNDVSKDPLFNREAAEATGFVPTRIIAAPVLSDGDAIGVMEVLDQTTARADVLSDLDLLAQLARQAAIALQLVRRAHAALALGKQAGDSYHGLARLVGHLEALDDSQRTAAQQLLEIISALFSGFYLHVD
jgi:GAF domain-containing protein